MRHLLFLLFLFSISLIKGQSVLNRDVLIQSGQHKVGALLDSIQQVLDIGVSYDVGVVNEDSIVELSIEKMKMFEVLHSIVDTSLASVSELNNQIVISRKEVEMATKYHSVKGVICDSDGKTMADVNIAIAGATIGTITNLNGEYILKYPIALVDSTVLISSLGYIQKHIILSGHDTLLNIQLEQHTLPLPEVEVKYMSGEDVMADVVHNINQNYADTSMLLTAFYRERIFNSTTLCEVVESVIEIYKGAYNRAFNLERTRFIKGRKYENVNNQNSIRLKLQGGPYYFARIDVARYLEFLPKLNQPSLYRYSYLGVDFEFDRMVYKIGFKPMDDSIELLYEGEFRIDASSYAIVSVDFQMTKRSIRRSKKYLIKKDTRNVKAKPEMARYYIGYRPVEGKWRLDRIQGELRIAMNDKVQKQHHDYVALTDLIVTESESVEKDRISSQERFKPNYILSDQIEVSDSIFWDNYNIILPEENLKNVFRNP